MERTDFPALWSIEQKFDQPIKSYPRVPRAVKGRVRMKKWLAGYRRIAVR
ncbi:MAG: hypothetical protein LOD87_05075 [Planifilum fulgidum]